MRSDFMSTRECKDLAMNWFAGEFRLAIEVSEVTSYRLASVLSSFAGEASSSSRKGATIFPRHVPKTLACATWAGSVAWSETAKLSGAAEPEGMSNLPQAEARWWVVGFFGIARQLQDGRRRFESWRRTSQFVLSCKSLLTSYTAVRMKYIASARHESSVAYSAH
jgi:hypothetical protein